MTNRRHQEIDFADAEALGSALIDRCQSTATMHGIVPGAFGDWGVQIGDRIFAISIRVAEFSEEKPA